MNRWITLSLLFVLTACSAPRVDNTRLGSADLTAMTDAMVQSMLADESLAERTTESAPMVIVADRVVNRTNDILPDGEKRAFTGRLRVLLNASQALNRRSMQFVQNRDLSGPNRVSPTHALTATFYADTVAERQRRTDTYLCAFQLTDLTDDRILWEDRYETKKTVVRNEMD
jgi:hypothetical protein